MAVTRSTIGTPGIYARSRVPRAVSGTQRLRRVSTHCAAAIQCEGLGNSVSPSDLLFTGVKTVERFSQLWLRPAHRRGQQRIGELAGDRRADLRDLLGGTMLRPNLASDRVAECAPQGFI